METTLWEKIDKICTFLLGWKKNKEGIYFDKDGNIQIPILNSTLKESDFILNSIQSLVNITIIWKKDRKVWLCFTDDFQYEDRHLPSCILELGYFYALKKENL